MNFNLFSEIFLPGIDDIYLSRLFIFESRSIFSGFKLVVIYE